MLHTRINASLVWLYKMYMTLLLLNRVIILQIKSGILLLLLLCGRLAYTLLSEASSVSCLVSIFLLIVPHVCLWVLQFHVCTVIVISLPPVWQFFIPPGIAMPKGLCFTAVSFFLSFFFVFVLFFQLLFSKVTEWISSKLVYIFTYDCYLKNLVRSPPGIYPLLAGGGGKTAFRDRLCTLTENISATEHDIKKRKSTGTPLRAPHIGELWSTNGWELLARFCAQDELHAQICDTFPLIKSYSPDGAYGRRRCQLELG